MISEEDLPKVSDTTEDRVILDTVRAFCIRFFSLERWPISLQRYLKSSRSIRISIGGMKLEGTMPNLKRSAIQVASLVSK
ncbi:hypothetical protein AN1V17_21230 [Vallitalea sediminicola]